MKKMCSEGQREHLDRHGGMKSSWTKEGSGKADANSGERGRG